MLKQRIITVLWLVPLVLGSIFFVPDAVFSWGLIGVLSLAGLEWGRIIDKDCEVTRWSFTATLVIILTILNLLVPTSEIWYHGHLHPVMMAVLSIGACWWIIATFLVITFPSSAKLWQKFPMLKSMFGQLTLLPCYTALVTLKSYHEAGSPYYGAMLILTVLLIVWAADTGAYFVGRKLGRNKLLPSVSPAKTIEGLLGGLVSSLLVVIFTKSYFKEEDCVLLIAVTLFVAISSALGDLVESMFKRVAGIKDSGTILPGHGGILDRIDSLTAALPVFTLVFITFWVK